MDRVYAAAQALVDRFKETTAIFDEVAALETALQYAAVVTPPATPADPPAAPVDPPVVPAEPAAAPADVPAPEAPAQS